MGTIDIEVKVQKTIDVNIEINDVIDAINEQPMLKRWNYIARILNEIHLDSDDFTEEQKGIVKCFLITKLELLDKSQNQNEVSR